MVENKFKKISVIFMTFAILASGHSYAYYKHVCNITQRVSQSFSADAFPCYPNSNATKTSESSNESSVKTKSCCDLTKIIKKTDSGNNHQFAFKTTKAVSLVLFITSIGDFDFTKITLLSESKILYHTAPPNFFDKLYILNSVFII